jgi:hypothetical protein
MLLPLRLPQNRQLPLPLPLRLPQNRQLPLRLLRQLPLPLL